MPTRNIWHCSIAEAPCTHKAGQHPHKIGITQQFTLVPDKTRMQATAACPKILCRTLALKSAPVHSVSVAGEVLW